MGKRALRSILQPAQDPGSTAVHRRGSNQMSPVLVATSAYGASMVRQLGQTHFIPVIASAGAAGIEIRRELFTSDTPDLVQMRHSIAGHGLFTVYSVPVELWHEDGKLAHDALHGAMI